VTHSGHLSKATKYPAKTIVLLTYIDVFFNNRKKKIKKRSEPLERTKRQKQGFEWSKGIKIHLP